jgi:patatin-like phospholipase/acyl hydrolase
MFKILSLDGGGIRGAFTASLLAEIEARLDLPIGRYFDLVAGTSTGALIAAAIASGMSANTIVEMYEKKSGQIFKPRPQHQPEKRRHRWGMPVARAASKAAIGVPFDDFLQSKYESQPLRHAIEAVFRRQLIGDLRMCRLVIPAVDVSAGRTIVFKTPHLPNMTRDRHYQISDVLMATTAAPTYFPHALLGSGSMVDGGLWANNPGMVAYTEAMKIRESAKRDCDPKFEFTDIHVLSIGTGEPRYSLSPPGDTAGLGWWGPRVFDITSISQSQGTHFQLQYLLDDRYTRLNFDQASARIDASRSNGGP